MLTDHRIDQERWAQRRREEKELARAYGRYITNLAPWDWFVTLTFRDRTLRKEACASIELRRHGRVAICTPDPRLVNYQPSSRYSPSGGPPAPAVVLRRIEQWLMDLQDVARSPVGWTIAEEFGRIEGRWHCHALVAGVSRLYRRSCWREAQRRFGYTRIVPFDPERGAALYAAKCAGRSDGQIHFGGTLAGVDLSNWQVRPARGGGRDVAVSVPLPKRFFHMTVPRRHR